jgi:two-component sensor histidine kinase
MSDLESDILTRTFPFLEGGGAMGAAITEFDWSETPVGPISGWSPVLRVAVSMMVNSAFPKCLCWGDDLIAIYNDSFVPILGRKHPCLGQRFADIWQEAWPEISGIAARALGGEATFIENFELEIERFGYPEAAWFTFCYSPVRDEDGIVRGMLNTVVETTAAVKAENGAMIRNRELLHRSRNSFALVSALIKQTHRTSETLDEAEAKILRRLETLDRAQDVLASNPGAGAPVSGVVAGAVALFEHGEGAITCFGPKIRIGSEQVIALAMALHELGTNASKYGALSVPDGRVKVEWVLDRSGETDTFRLHWTESGGPPVEVPERRGFGSFLIDQALAARFRGSVEIDYASTGLRLSLHTDARYLTRGPAE